MFVRRTLTITAALALSTGALCAPLAAQSGTSSPAAPATGAWRSLSDDMSAWRGFKTQELPKGWGAAMGVITKPGNAEDLVSRDEFANFEFALDWKIAEGGNAGLFYRATEEYEKIYWSGPEYQILDDARAPDGKNRLTSAAAAYGLYAPPAGGVTPAGEWYSTRIIVKGSHVEHWLNEQKVVEYELGSADWAAKVKASKFGAWPNYGRAKSGHIGIQGDHKGLLSLRNVKIRVLP